MGADCGDSLLRQRQKDLKYSLVVSGGKFKAAEFKLVYGDKKESSIVNKNGNYCIVFEATDSNEAYFYAISTEGVSSINLMLKDYKASDFGEGPQVNQSTTVTPGTDAASAVKIDLGSNFVIDGTYTLRLTYSETPGADWDTFTMFTYHILCGGQEINVQRSAQADENPAWVDLKFTATTSEVKIFADGAYERGSGNPKAPVKVTVTVIAAPVTASAAVGDQTALMPGDGKTNAVELAFNFEAGKTYKIKLTAEVGSPAWNFTYHLLSGTNESNFAYTGEDLFATITVAEDGIVKFYCSEHMGRFGGQADLEQVTLEIIAIS